jgi:stearoyl-CoA desaturase (delta-9 desaturase)
LDLSSDSVLGLAAQQLAAHASPPAAAAAPGDEHRRDAHHHAHDISLGIKITNIFAVVVPFLGLIGAIFLVWGWGFSWTHLCVMAGMYLATGFGITIGFHRLFTHKSFETSKVMQALFAILGSMAVEGPVFKWVAQHRLHHQHSDEAEDPHSPHLHGHGFKGMLRGLWHSHVGWLFEKDYNNLQRYIPDLAASRVLTWISNTFTLWVAVGLLIPTVLGGVLTMSWSGALVGFIWGGLARIFLVHHVTWSINSVCHIWGSQPYRSHDESRNNVVFGVLAMGEGWHNNHHAFPTSAKHGLAWWQVDVSYYVIRLMELVGLAWRVRVPAASALEAKRAK